MIFVTWCNPPGAIGFYRAFQSLATIDKSRPESATYPPPMGDKRGY